MRRERQSLVFDTENGAYWIETGDEGAENEYGRRRTLYRGVRFRNVQTGAEVFEEEGEIRIEISPLGRLTLEDQLFAVAFLRTHGSIKKMEGLFGISYPTVKNRLNAITAELDKSFDAPTPNSVVLDQLARGEITVDEALERMSR